MFTSGDIQAEVDGGLLAQEWEQWRRFLFPDDLEFCSNRNEKALAGFRKGRGNRDQIANICEIIEKVREFQKNIYFCFFDHMKAFGCVDHNKLWNILKEMGMPDHLSCLLKNLYVG